MPDYQQHIIYSPYHSSYFSPPSFPGKAKKTDVLPSEGVVDDGVRDEAG